VRTESYKRGFVSILLASAMLLSMVFIATPVLAPGVIEQPGGTTIEVYQGQDFIVRFKCYWDEPEPGFFALGVYWDSPGVSGTPSENFTFLAASAYMEDGTPIEPLRVELTEGVVGGNMRYTVVVGNPEGPSPYNGNFFVDLRFRAAGAGGVPHIPGTHTMVISGTIDVFEATTFSYAPPNPYITIRVLELPVGVIVRTGTNAFDNSLPATPPAYRLYSGENIPLVAAQKIGSGAVVALGLTSTLNNGRWDNALNPYKYFDKFLHAAIQWAKPGASKIIWDTGYGTYQRGTIVSNIRGALTALGYTVVEDNLQSKGTGIIGDNDVLIVAGYQLGARYSGGDPALLPDEYVDNIKSWVRNAGGVLLIFNNADFAGYNYYRVQNKILKALDFGWCFQSDSVYDPVDNWGGAAFNLKVRVDTTTAIGSRYIALTGTDLLGVYSPTSLLEWPTFAVDVSISPSESSAKYEENVTFNVTVRNTGTAWDNYAITVSSARGWSLNYTVPARVFLNPGEEFSFVVEETIGSDVYCTRDNLTVEAVGQESFWAPATDSATAKAHSLGKALLLRGVAVEIEPGHQEAQLVIDPEWGDKRYDPLTFKVIVKNTGVLDDKYVLSVSDDKGWMLELMPIELYIEAGKSDIAVLSVTVPKDAVGCTTDTITIVATGTMATGTGDDLDNAVIENTCTVHVAEARGVRVDILPWEVQTGTPGSKLRWIVKVKNLGNVEDTYSLSVSQNVRDNERGYNAWSYTLEPSSLTLPGCNFGQAILEVTIPSDLKTCVWNDITVTATGTGVSDDATVQAHVLVPGPRVPQGWIKLTVEVEVIAIEVWPTSWNFGILDEAEIAQTASDYFTVRNVGNKDVNITIAGNDAKSEPGAPVATWTLDELGNIGLDRYVMWFGSPPATILDKTGKTLVSGLKPGEEYNFGLKIQAPSSITVPSRMWTVVTLTAVRA